MGPGRVSVVRFSVLDSLYLSWSLSRLRRVTPATTVNSTLPRNNPSHQDPKRPVNGRVRGPGSFLGGVNGSTLFVCEGGGWCEDWEERVSTGSTLGDPCGESLLDVPKTPGPDPSSTKFKCLPETLYLELEGEGKRNAWCPFLNC